MRPMPLLGGGNVGSTVFGKSILGENILSIVPKAILLMTYSWPFFRDPRQWKRHVGFSMLIACCVAHGMKFQSPIIL